jgi:hypothetical protein
MARLATGGLDMDNWETKFGARPVRTGFSLSAAILIGLMGLAIIGGAGFWIINIMSQPARIISKTLDADNVINRYEWYFDSKAQIDARVSQIKGHQGIIAVTTDQQEVSRLRLELAAIQQSCRDLTQRYDANSQKLNVGLFRDWKLPERIDPANCEVTQS